MKKLYLLFAISIVVFSFFAFVSPKEKYIYWIQAYVLGKTNYYRSNVIAPRSGYTGKWHTYHNDLSLDSEMDFVNGKLTGKWIRHTKGTGIIWWSGTYLNNACNGEWITYTASGSVDRVYLEYKQYDPIGEWPVMIFWCELPM